MTNLHVQGRKICPTQYDLGYLETGIPGEDKAFQTWLEEKASAYQYLLAHADDGVIWGYLKEGQLITSDQAFPDVSPPLHAQTLQQLRLFSEKGELHLWRTEPGQFQGRVITDDTSGTSEKYFDEDQILWGTRWLDYQKGFTLVVEGQRGLRHAFPKAVTNDKAHFGTQQNPKHPLRLKIRHYLDYDKETSQARISLSRLVDLYSVNGQKGDE